MRLRDDIIVREESEGFLLYNGDNGGLVAVAKPVYRCLIGGNGESQPAVDQLRHWLLESDFLERRPPAEERPGYSEGFSEGAETFFDLGSEISPLSVLWALTARCNLRCLYCFPDVKSQLGKTRSLPRRQLLDVADQLVEAKVLKVTLSGGEALLERSIWQIIERLRSVGTTVSLISNGTLLREEQAQRLHSLGVPVGVSLDGADEATNRITRGDGVYGKVLRTIDRLLRQGVQTSVIVTLTRHNFDGLERLIDLIAARGVKVITIQDLRPFGTKELYDRTRLTTAQEKRLKATVQRVKANHPSVFFNTTELFIFSKTSASDRVMQCPAGNNFAYIDFHGDVYPCTSLPFLRLGNLVRDGSLSALWQESEAMEKLRRIKDMPLESLPYCASCSNKAHCEGGCRGDAVFYCDDLLGRPSRCPQRLDLPA